MRIKQNVLNGKDDEYIEENEEDQKSNIDRKFRKIREYIRNKRKQLMISSDRFTSDDNNYNGSAKKFKLDTIEISMTDGKSDDTATKNTCLDAIFTEIKDEIVNTTILHKLQEFVYKEHYDTDALLLDIIEHEFGSNIINTIGNEDFTSFIIDYLEEQNCMFICNPPYI